MRGSLIKLAVVAGLLLQALPARAQVVIDGTLGTAGSLAGPDYAIGAALGQQVGGNLFHSFSDFNIHAGQSATFSGPANVDNIISRVTGGRVSTIDGLLRATIPGADFYMVNPAGVIFGENAQLDLPGSFHIGTADVVELNDGGRFDAANPVADILTVAPPAAFGFLGGTPAGVALRGSSLSLADGATFAIVAGGIEISAGEDPAIEVESGRVALVSLAGPGSVSLTDFEPDGGSLLGTLSLSGEGAEDNGPELGDDAPDPQIDVSGDPGGRVILRAGDLFAADFSISADSEGARAGPAVAIDIAVTGRLELSGESLFATIAEGSAAGGDVMVSAGEVALREESEILSDTGGSGAGGAVNITADRVFLSGDAEIASDVDEGAGGAGGSVSIVAGEIIVAGDAEISSDTGGSGDGGSVRLTATDFVQLSGSGGVFANSKATGDAGDIVIDAGLRFLSDGGTVATSALTSDGGNIILRADRLIDLANSAITTSVGNGFGNGGNISIDPDFLVLDQSRIQANAFGGNGGNITIVAGQLLATPDSVIQASSQLGIQGTIVVTATQADLAGELSALSDSLLDASSKLQPSCNARSGEALSSLERRGRGGLPPSPEGPLASDYLPPAAIGAPSQETASLGVVSGLGLGGC